MLGWLRAAPDGHTARQNLRRIPAVQPRGVRQSNNRPQLTRRSRSTTKDDARLRSLRQDASKPIGRCGRGNYIGQEYRNSRTEKLTGMHRGKITTRRDDAATAQYKIQASPVRHGAIGRKTLVSGKRGAVRGHFLPRRCRVPEGIVRHLARPLDANARPRAPEQDPRAWRAADQATLPLTWLPKSESQGDQLVLCASDLTSEGPC